MNDDKNTNQSSLFEINENTENNFEFLPSTPWKQKELLSEEFNSLGFFISDHPLSEFKEAFNQLNIITYDQFINSDKSEGLVSGTIMAIQEIKSAKGTPYGIVKFSDNKGELELFLFSENLISNRERLKVSESFMISLQKDKVLNPEVKKRLNVKKILPLEDVINKPYSKVTIEIKEDSEINEIKEILSLHGDTQIELIINYKNKKAHYSLQNNRKFNLNHLKALKAKEYVKKIIV